MIGGDPMSTPARAESLKRPVNLTLSADLVARSKALGINLSAVAEEALAQAVKARTQEAWLKENAAAIATYNQRVAASGVFGDEFRSF